MDFPSYALYDVADHHDPEGVIFIRRVTTSLEGLALGQLQEVSWFKAGSISLNPQELYVRMYATRDTGGHVPTHYVRLDVVKGMLDYQKFCNINGLQYKPTLDYYNEIEKAIDEFDELMRAEIG